MDNQPSVTGTPEIKFFVILVATLFLLLVISFIFNLKIQKGDIPTSSGIASKSFPEVNLRAKAVYVYDARAKTVLFAQNENTRLSLASLTKIMSALVARDLTPLHSTITVNGEALQMEGDSGFYRDERWSLEDILDFSLLTSSNDGMRAVALSLGAISKANVVSEEVVNDFVREMNRKASELGLKNTYFWNETGLDLPLQADESDAMKGGAYGTARDMNALMEYILMNQPELLTATREVVATFSSVDNHIHTAKNTNSIVSEIPGLLASKTGSTDTAGGNLIIVFDPELGRPIIISILGSTEQDRFEDARILIDAVMEYINNN